MDRNREPSECPVWAVRGSLRWTQGPHGWKPMNQQPDLDTSLRTTKGQEERAIACACGNSCLWIEISGVPRLRVWIVVSPDNRAADYVTVFQARSTATIGCQ